MTILIDSREPKKIIEYFDENNITYTVGALAYGDYIIEGSAMKMVIERKNIFDLFGSVKDGRLWKQLDGLMNYSDYRRVLLIEGQIGAVIAMKRGTYPQWIGILSKVFTTWDVEVIMVPDFGSTLMLLDNIYRKLDGADTVHATMPKIKKRAKSLDDEYANIVMSIGGIGEKTFAKLAVKFKSLSDLMSATQGDITKILGNKRGEHMYAVLHHVYGDTK